MGPIKTEKTSFDNVLPSLPYPDPALAAMGEYPKKEFSQIKLANIYSAPFPVL